MKKLKFNFKKSLLILFITILGVFSTTGIISAASGSSGVGKSFLTSAGFDVIVPEITVDGEKGACLNFDLAFPNGEEYEMLNFAYEQPEILGALYYGYDGVDNSLQDKYGIPDEQASYARNIVIWRHAHDLGIPSNSGSFRNLALKGNAHPNLLDYLEELATKRFNPTQPITLSFSGNTNVENGKQVSDWIVLSDNISYDVEVYNGATLEVKEGNRFKVSVPTYFSGNVGVKVVPTTKNFKALVWRTQSAGKQDIIQLNKKDPLPSVDVNVNFKVLSAHIEVLKVDEKGNVVPGVVFEQSTTPDFSSDVWELTTGENGIGKDTWNRGDITVYVREKSVPKHLVKSSEVKKVQLKTNETTRIKFVNEIVKGNIEVIKVDGENSNKKLQGAVFELKQGNKVIQTATSNAQGTVLFKDVLYGDYTVTEKSSPEGYRLNPAVLNVKVDANNKTYKYNFNNYKIKGSIEVLKVDAEDSTKVLPGVTFALFKDNTEIATAITNEQGIARFENLVYGDYVVREKATLEHYVLSNEFKNVSIKNHNEVVKFTLTNNKIYGEIEVLKVAEHDNNLKLPGAVFELRKDGKVIDTQTTNKDGIARFTKVEYGDVEIVEVQAPQGYFLPKDNTRKAKIEVQKQVIQFTAKNEAEPSIQTQAHGENLKPQELVEPTEKTLIYEELLIKDVVKDNYRVIVEGIDPITKKVLVTEIHEFKPTTTEYKKRFEWVLNGFELPNGITFKETLERKNEKGEWEFKYRHNEDGKDKNQTVKFKKYGKVTVFKVDSLTKEKIERFVKFGLFRNGQLIEEKTSESGFVVFEKLISGEEYEVKELEAPLGYIKSDEVLKVTITDDNQELSFEYENELLPVIKREVESGDASNILAYALAAMISLVGVFGLRRKEDRD